MTTVGDDDGDKDEMFSGLKGVQHEVNKRFQENAKSVLTSISTPRHDLLTRVLTHTFSLIFPCFDGDIFKNLQEVYQMNKERVVNC